MTGADKDDPRLRVAKEILAAVRALARHREGAILLWDPAVPIFGGVVLDALVTRALLLAAFNPDSLNPLRGGAVVIRGDRIERAAVPLDWRTVVETARELAAGLAIQINAATGEIRTVDREGRVDEVGDEDVLARTLRAHTVVGLVPSSRPRT